MGSTSRAKGTTFLEVGKDGVAIITIHNPPVNLLSVDVMLSFKENCEQALQRDDVKAIVISGSSGKFSGGFDVTAFGRKVERGNVGYFSIDFFTDTFEAARKPLVAAIDGPALGGGLEIALACHARISTSSARLGLPELRYGILPGWGGTQRLPRLVGLRQALDMMLMSKLVNGDQAQGLGLVDAIATAEDLIDTARCWALDMSKGRKPWVASLYRTDKLEPLAEARLMLKFARHQVQKRTPNLTHPLVCIGVIEEGLVSGPRVGLWKESEALLELRQSITCKSLVHFFFAQRVTSKIPGISYLGLVPKEVKRIGVVGGGLMGSGIATTLILSNFQVVLKEANYKSLAAGIDRIKASLQSRVDKGTISQKKVAEILFLLEGVIDYRRFGDLDMVIEAVTENISEKQHIFVELEKYCPQHCIFVSSTSTINLNRISEKANSQNRIAGAHFFSLAHDMPLMEIVRTERTSPQVTVDLVNVGRKLKKTPVIVYSVSAMTRIFSFYYQGASLLAELGVDVYRIDRAVTKFGLPMGPFRMMDLVGFEDAIAASFQFIENFPERSYKSMLIPLMQEDNRAGEASGRGFYVYDNNRRATHDPDISKYVDKARNISGVTARLELLKLSDQDIVEMILFPVVNEACRLLKEGIVVKASDLDVAAVMGMGFPVYRFACLCVDVSCNSAILYI
ncbi:hypothetical protein Tsubulata_021565 [Turnera subulata]|uniref:3-hydroxyacyl-CoA dehydrogenase n=1 Tax=Turnera subulata TaxID=218843 RepID=A0A9Q0GGM7_9ROSI|nr:hypothetical protein Tsubulata_021565 [Turnera subulata]